MKNTEFDADFKSILSCFQRIRNEHQSQFFYTHIEFTTKIYAKCDTF